MAVHDRFGPSNHSTQSGAGANAPAAPTVPAHEAIATAPTTAAAQSHAAQPHAMRATHLAGRETLEGEATPVTAPTRPRPAAHQAAQWAATLLANLNATRP